MGHWRDGGVHKGDVILVGDDNDHRLGNGAWTRGRLRAGDLLVAIEHAGDCFHTYMLLQAHEMLEGGRKIVNRRSIQAVPATFGAYVLGRTVGTLDATRLAELIAGGTLTVHLAIEPEAVTKAERTLDVKIPPSMLDRAEVAGTGHSVQELIDALLGSLDGVQDHDLEDQVGLELAPRLIALRKAVKPFWRDADGRPVAA